MPHIPLFRSGAFRGTSLAGIEIPGDRIYDGYDISPLMFGTGKSQREVVFYYRGEQVYAIRKGHYKAHFITQLEYGSRTAHFITDPEIEIERRPVIQDPPLLYHLSIDPSEKYNISGEHPKVVAEIQQILSEHLSGIKPVENQLER